MFRGLGLLDDTKLFRGRHHVRTAMAKTMDLDHHGGAHLSMLRSPDQATRFLFTTYNQVRLSNYRLLKGQHGVSGRRKAELSAGSLQCRFVSHLVPAVFWVALPLVSCLSAGETSLFNVRVVHERHTAQPRSRPVPA